MAAAKNRGGNDNITVVIVDVVDDDDLSLAASDRWRSDPGVHIPEPHPGRSRSTAATAPPIPAPPWRAGPTSAGAPAGRAVSRARGAQAAGH